MNAQTDCQNIEITQSPEAECREESIMLTSKVDNASQSDPDMFLQYIMAFLEMLEMQIGNLKIPEEKTQFQINENPNVA